MYAYDRCINSSGVLRYRTSRGWVSELTRGHGRENITEILDVSVRTSGVPPLPCPEVKSKRTECGVPDLRSAAASVLARMHETQSSLFNSLEKIVLAGSRPQRATLTAQNQAVAPHVVAAMKILSSNLKKGFEYVSDAPDDSNEMDTDDSAALANAKCMYYGNQLSVLRSCLVSFNVQSCDKLSKALLNYHKICAFFWAPPSWQSEEKTRDESRRMFDVPLLVNLMVGDGWKDGIYPAQTSDEPTRSGIISAIRFVLLHSLRDMAVHAAKDSVPEELEQKDLAECAPRTTQRMSRAVAVALSPTLTLLRRLVSRQQLVETQMASALTKMSENDMATFLTSLPKDESDDAPKPKFNAVQFARRLSLEIGKLTLEVWSDDDFSSVPSHVMHPYLGLMGDVLRSLEEAAKVVNPSPAAGTENTAEALLSSVSGRLRDLQDPTSRHGRILASMGLLRGALGNNAEESAEPFEPSEEAISQLAEMGFGRDHAIEALEVRRAVTLFDSLVLPSAHVIFPDLVRRLRQIGLRSQWNMPLRIRRRRQQPSSGEELLESSEGRRVSSESKARVRQPRMRRHRMRSHQIKTGLMVIQTR